MKTAIFGDYIKTILPKTKIQAKAFLDEGKFPIVSQEARSINGFWNNVDDLIRVKNPVIIFGDHTRVIKYIDFDFVPGADGTKILSPPDEMNARYLYYWLLANPIKSLGYSRHFRILKDYEITIPSPEGQRRVVERLDAAFEKIDRAIELTESNIKNTLKLFKNTRTTVLSEAKNDKTYMINEIGINLDSKRVPITKKDRKSGPYPYYGASGIVDYVDNYIFDQTTLLISEDGANLIARTTPIAFIADGKYWVNNHAHIYGFNEATTLKYLEHYFENTDLKPYITGAAQPKLSQSNLNKIPVHLPSIDDQKIAVERIEDTKKKSYALQKFNDNKLSLLLLLKQSMLQQAFSGDGVQ